MWKISALAFLFVFSLMLPLQLVYACFSDMSLGIDDTSNLAEVHETIMLNVLCDQATASVSLTIMSHNHSLIHFPNEVNMFDSHLENAVKIMVGRTPTLIGDSFVTALNYGFKNISQEEARVNADAITQSMNSAFGVSFTWMSTNTSDTTVVVGYTAIGSSNLTSFAELLASTCVTDDLGGFSKVLSLMPMVFTVGITTEKEAGSFNWTTSITAVVIGRSIPTGSNSHTVNVLNLLGAPSLAPSPYSYDNTSGTYTSIVMLTVTSSNPLSFISCQPPLAPTPGEKGWTDSALPNLIMTQFNFGSDPTTVTELTYTFSGIVIPEFTELAIILMFVFATSAILILRKRSNARAQ